LQRRQAEEEEEQDENGNSYSNDALNTIDELIVYLHEKVQNVALLDNNVNNTAELM
jgi:hypothetical protein